MMRTALILALLTTSLPARAGGSSAHGGDLDRDQDNVWFLGDEPVEYCILRKDDYPLTLAQLEASAGQALDQWRAFFAKYGLDKRSFQGLADGSSRGLALTFHRVDACTHPESQLQLAFDVRNELVEDHRPDDDSSLGVAVRGAYDHRTYRTGGVVWIARFTDDPVKLQHLLLHELGHVFGMAHNTVWVMDDTVARRLTNPYESKDPALGSIESPAWPFQLRPGETLTFSYRYGAAAPNYILPGALSDLLGLSSHDFFGKHQLSVIYQPAFEPGSEAPFGRKTFTLRIDRPGLPETRLAGVFDLAFKRGAGPVLYTRWRSADGSAPQFDKRYLLDDVIPVPASGYFTAADGTRIPAVLSTHWGPVLRLFIPATGAWWNTESYELSLERQQMDQY